LELVDIFGFMCLVARSLLQESPLSVTQRDMPTGKEPSQCGTYFKKFWDFIHAPVVIFAYHVVVRHCSLYRSINLFGFVVIFWI